MKVVWQSFEGRYSDSPRVLYERWRHQRPDDEHVWLADPAQQDGFAREIRTVAIYGPDCVRALESADLVIANTHTDVEWNKRDSALYLQLWHGTPLKRIHRDVRWAPPGRLDRLSRDIARWDVLVSPNQASTPRLRKAFDYDREIIETGYPRNDLLSSPDRAVVRARVRAQLGIADDVSAVLYTPTWRDDLVFADEAGEIPFCLDVDAVVDGLGPKSCLLVRVHSLVCGRQPQLHGERVIDVSRHSDVAELYLAADAMVTDYSSTMFDFAITGKPMAFFVPDLDRFRDEVRGFYFDLEDEAPGPLLRTQDDLIAALRELPSELTPAYRRFRERYCSLEDGGATDRVLGRLLT